MGGAWIETPAVAAPYFPAVASLRMGGAWIETRETTSETRRPESLRMGGAWIETPPGC